MKYAIPLGMINYFKGYNYLIMLIQLHIWVVPKVMGTFILQ